MLRYVFDRSDLVGVFVARMIPHLPPQKGFERCRTIGVVNARGELVAGLVYHNWNPNAGTIEISGAALPNSNWVTRTTLRVMHAYPFEQLHCQLVKMTVRADDVKLQRALAALGYMFVLAPREFGRDADGVSCRLTGEAWDASIFNTRLENRMAA